MLKTLVTLVLAVHGLGHIMGFLASWTSIPMGFTDRPWIFGNGAVNSLIGRVWGLLWLAALAVFLIAAVGLWQEKDWSKTAALIASLLSLVAIVPWWNTVTPGSKIGAILVDLAVLAAVVLGGWDKIPGE